MPRQQPIETLRHPSGIVAKIIPDDDSEGPDQWGNEDVFLVAFHRQFTIARKDWSQTKCESYLAPEGARPKRWDAKYREDYRDGSYWLPKGDIGNNAKQIDRADSYLRESQAEYDEQVKRSAEYAILPLIAYIHSGVALSLGRNSYPFTDRFDSGQVGYVVIKRDAVTDIDAAASALVDEWNQYLSGDVYGIVIEDADGEELESCWGYYGLDYAREEARSQILNHASQGVLPFVNDSIKVTS